MNKIKIRNEKKKFHILMIAIVAIIIIFGFIISGNNSKRLLKYTKYTSALITSDWHHKNNTGVGVDYEYYLNGKKYKYTINLDLKKNQKYLLAYDSLKPNNCRILEIYPLNKDITATVNGWNLMKYQLKLTAKRSFNILKQTNNFIIIAYENK